MFFTQFRLRRGPGASLREDNSGALGLSLFWPPFWVPPARYVLHQTLPNSPLEAVISQRTCAQGLHGGDRCRESPEKLLQSKEKRQGKVFFVRSRRSSRIGDGDLLLSGTSVPVVQQLPDVPPPPPLQPAAAAAASKTVESKTPSVLAVLQADREPPETPEERTAREVSEESSAVAHCCYPLIASARRRRARPQIRTTRSPSRSSRSGGRRRAALLVLRTRSSADATCKYM